MRTSVALLMTLLASSPVAAQESPYAAEEGRDISSLSAEEVDALRSGDGMGLAKLAELNHFPGPRHVLDLAAELGLTQEQLRKTEALFEEMNQNAIALGEELLEAERALDHQRLQGAHD